jgi:hypothetical protein
MVSHGVHAVIMQSHQAGQRLLGAGRFQKMSVCARPIANAPGKLLAGHTFAFPTLLYIDVQRHFRPATEAQHLAHQRLRLWTGQSEGIERPLPSRLIDQVTEDPEMLVGRHFVSSSENRRGQV